ncbi:hypothetical protein BR63_09365 [Thermanaerosceptrum fracticalcis]|uniref:MurNAc-LAA domain-containing protein n=1 Tax=Thermanaerosceptrum fracticalcis TaxID=1712410 RepID=A0A7G6E347_THEFR|nr:divergent polysaccharide deacetylase family protein [Thermanaerosceptrum fracticalcis]QNB46501.1 hypothetical protein BR63_09365 [Thermanaerosceptrum fracticalcis]
MKKLRLLVIKKRVLYLFILSFLTLILTYTEYKPITTTFGELMAPICIINKKVFLDPGHGGEDPGCNDPRLGIYEEDINLKVASKTREILTKAGAEVIMSRESDKDYVLPKALRGDMTKKRCDLTTRISIAEEGKADVFVSLHVNATRKRSYAGAETFYNPAEPDSVLLAQNIQKHLRSIPDMTKRIPKPGNYFLLKNASMPSVIVEMGYLSNSKEKELLVQESYQEALALAISRGLIDYFKDCTLRLESPSVTDVIAIQKPKVAIIIDDLGHPYNKGVEEIMALHKYPLTLAVMPNMEKTVEHALRAEKNGFEVLIHMPMEPEYGNSNWLGPGAIKNKMSRQEITLNLRKALDQIPNAVGLNNHMGSLVTQKRELMLPVMEFLKENYLFYVDSRTSEKTVCRDIAGEVGVPYTERTLFLDNQYDYASIKREILKLGQLAQLNGYAIGIGHVGPQGLNTAKALADTLPLLEEQGIDLVFVSELFVEQNPFKKTISDG